MGTNYYYYSKEAIDPCPTCGHKEVPLHIGKSSAGWSFLIRIHPEKSICTIYDWARLFFTPLTTIKNEYGDEIDPFTMLDTIARRTGEAKHRKQDSETQPQEGTTYDYTTDEFC